MKGNKGITLNSLIIYIAAMLIVIALVGSITSNFYSKTKGIEQNTKDISSLNIFNSYFTKEVKTLGNKVNDIGESYIIFTSGNIFTFKDNKVFYNTLQICSNVKNVKFEFQNDNNRDVIKVTIEFNTFSNPKEMFYKIEEIY